MNPQRILSGKRMLSIKKGLHLVAQTWRKTLFLVISILALLSITACVAHIETHVVFYPNEEWKAEIRLSFTPQQAMLLGGEQALEAELQKEVAAKLRSGDIRYVLKKEPQNNGGVHYIVSMEGKGVQEFNQAVFSKAYMAELLAGPVSLDVTGNISEGQILTIGLDSNPSTGYSWEVAELDPKILRQVGESEYKQDSRLLGAAGKQIFRFGAVGAGQTSLKLIYHRSWEKGVEPTRKIFIEAVEVDLVDLFAQLNSATSTPALAQQGASGRALTIARVRGNPIASSDNTNTVYLPLVMKNYLALPLAYNWCDLGACTPVKDQGGCGSCWAFGTVGPLESNIKLRDGVDEDLSEQYLVSCNTDGWNCIDGGWWAHDYHWNKIPPSESEAGAVLEAEFPYEGEDVPCSGPYAHPYKLNSWACIGDADPPDCCTGSVLPTADIKQAIYDHGPVSVAVCAGLPGSQFQYYTGGVFEYDESSDCGLDKVNHAVVLVGWDDTQGTSGVWYSRNSWGTAWGENGGYMRIGYGISNVGSCANYIVYSPSVPVTSPSANLRTVVSEGFGGAALLLGICALVKRGRGSKP